MAGRPRKPTAIHKLNGNPGKRKLNEAEPQPEAGEPTMPTGMSTLARREWRRIVPLLLAMSVLTEVDGIALSIYCEAYATYRVALKDIKTKGLTYTAANGGLKVNPAVYERDKAIHVMRMFLTDFGMSPASRTRIHVTKKEAIDPFEQFMHGISNSDDVRQ